MTEPSPAALFDLTGRVAVVTGGSRGIGRAIAGGLAAAGADVVIASRKLDSCEKAASEITASWSTTPACPRFTTTSPRSPMSTSTR